jgi:hypothetical protein
MIRHDQDPGATAALRLRSKAGSTKPVPCVALINASAIPAPATAGQSIAPLWCDTSITPSQTTTGSR